MIIASKTIGTVHRKIDTHFMFPMTEGAYGLFHPTVFIFVSAQALNKIIVELGFKFISDLTHG